MNALSTTLLKPIGVLLLGSLLAAGMAACDAQGPASEPGNAPPPAPAPSVPDSGMPTGESIGQAPDGAMGNDATGDMSPGTEATMPGDGNPDAGVPPQEGSPTSGQ